MNSEQANCCFIRPVQLAPNSGPRQAEPSVGAGGDADDGRRAVLHRQELVREARDLRRRLRHLGRRELGAQFQGESESDVTL